MKVTAKSLQNVKYLCFKVSDISKIDKPNVTEVTKHVSAFSEGACLVLQQKLP